MVEKKNAADKVDITEERINERYCKGAAANDKCILNKKYIIKVQLPCRKRDFQTRY